LITTLPGSFGEIIQSYREAKICGECREMWIDEEVLQELDKLIEYGVPVRKMETPVYDFSRAPAPAH
jgi:Zn-finger nucleic acid-binding protein